MILFVEKENNIYLGIHTKFVHLRVCSTSSSFHSCLAGVCVCERESGVWGPLFIGRCLESERDRWTRGWVGELCCLD